MSLALLFSVACTGADPADTKTTPQPVEDTAETGTPDDTGDTDTGDTDDRGPHTRPVDTGCATPTTWYLDADEDGYGDPDRAVVRCDPPAMFVADATDCDDTEPEAHPLGTESCNDADDDCDGEVDEAGATGEITLYPDADGDGWGVDGAETMTACSPRDGFGWYGDCDDGDAGVSPGAVELCDGLDQDCDGDAEDDAYTASYDDGSGVLVDVTGIVGDGSKYDSATVGDLSIYDYVATEGTLWLCEGTWRLKVILTDADTHLVVKSRQGPAYTMMTTDGTAGGASGSIVTVQDATLEIEGITLSGGAGASGTNGGAIIVNASTAPSSPNITLTDCVVTGNDTDYGGAVAIYGSAWVSVVDTLVAENNATVAGGGVWMSSSGRFDCEATTLGAAGITGNTAPLGGGVYLSSETSGQVSTTGCDWGDDDAGDDNADYDVEQNPAGEGHQWCWKDATSLASTISCSGATCTSSTDTTCP